MTPQLFRALVVEDDFSWQQILNEILSDAGLAVDTANNVNDALRKMKAEPHKLAVVDLSLAGDDFHNSDGLRVLEAVRIHDPQCQSILLTGFATVELAVSVLTEYGALTFLRKEKFHRAHFRGIIDQVLANVPAPENTSFNSGEQEPHHRSDTDASLSPKDNKILIVEDDAGWRNILHEILSDAGYNVVISVGLGDAIGQFRHERFNLAIVDLSLSNDVYFGQTMQKERLAGFELLDCAKSAGIPTIVVSGLGSASEIQRIYSEQAIFAFLEKQAFDRDVFKLLVEKALRTQTSRMAEYYLTAREQDVLDLLAGGSTNKEIAEKLVISINTVKRHIKAIFKKLGVHTRSAAVAKAVGDML